MKKQILIGLSVMLFLISCSHPPLLKPHSQCKPSHEAVVKSGIEVLVEQNFEGLKNKRVGLITNATGIDRNFRSTIDILNEAEEVNLVALFGPEHGVRGDRGAGELIRFYTDKKTRLPVYPLYGETRKPTKLMLKKIDVLVFDIQDIGCRSYTYISTMGLCMEAAAEEKIKMIVLDRPNPLGGNYVSGNILEDEFRSFVGQFNIPYVYGLTVGELANLLNNENMLSNGLSCDLTVIPMVGWKRSMIFRETGLPWIPTSPHIPQDDTPFYYASTGILGELGVFSNGVGYTLPFKMIGASWIDGDLLADKMNKLGLDGVVFRSVSYKPYYGFGNGTYLGGVQIHYDNASKADLLGIQFLFMEVHNELYPDKKPFKLAKESRIKMFDKVMGSDKIRKTFQKIYRYNDISTLFDKDVKAFKNISKKYYLYQ